MGEMSMDFKKRRLNELKTELALLEEDVRRYDENHGTSLLIPEKIEMTPTAGSAELYPHLLVITNLAGATLTAAEAGRVAKFADLYAKGHGAKGVV